MSVISCVEGATDRVNHLVIVEKMLKNWSLRLCLDPPDLTMQLKVSLTILHLPNKFRTNIKVIKTIRHKTIGKSSLRCYTFNVHRLARKSLTGYHLEIHVPVC